MKKLILLVPLCLCIVAGMVMSGCGTSDIVNIPAAITSLSLSDGGGDIEFAFKYIDNPDVTGNFIIQYADSVVTPTVWTSAIVLDAAGGSAAVLTDREPDDYIFFWDTDGAVPVSDGTYIFRVQVDLSYAVPDLPGTNTEAVTVTN